jgi:hypothetical protein
MRLIRLAVALVAISSSWAALANPALNNTVIGSASTTAATQAVAGATQASLDVAALGSEPRRSLSRSSSTRSSSASARMNDSVPSGWLMALVTVLLIGHQLRRKHRFLRPHRFSNL